MTDGNVSALSASGRPEDAGHDLVGTNKVMLREQIARAIWAKRPDCTRKPWPIETAVQRRAYPHNPIAACDLCFEYADAAIATIIKWEEETGRGRKTPLEG